MGRLSNIKKIKLLEIEKARLKLSLLLQNDFINERDIISILGQDINFGTRYEKSYNYRLVILRDIFNCPFLLCDQDYLSINLKKLLPNILDCRYKTEREELDKNYELGYINEKDYKFDLDMLNFCYYGSTIDGKNILKYGKAKKICDNVLRTK